MAQHITLSGDGGGGCEHEGQQSQSCEQIMITTDGGKTYQVAKKIRDGTSGNFNGYGDLGSWVPPKTGAKTPPGQFQTIVGCNDCFTKGGGSLVEPAFLQTWVDSNGNLTLANNVSITYKNTPAAFTGTCGAKGTPCGFSSPDQSIIRTPNTNLLMALYGHAADGYQKGSKYSTAFYSSSDDGLTWSYTSRVDVTPAMLTGQGPGEGPCEPTMATLADGRVLAAFRLEGGHPL